MKHTRNKNRDVFDRLSKTVKSLPRFPRAILAACALSLTAGSISAEYTFTWSREARDQYKALGHAGRFLSQASFGGTESEITALAARIRAIGHTEACEEWIDNQFITPKGENMHDMGEAIIAADGIVKDAEINGFYTGWWHSAINAPDQLALRTSFALSQIFVTSQEYWGGLYRKARWAFGSDYLEMLRDNAFTSHRNLLNGVTYNPLMGGYLTYIYNPKADPVAGTFPDENYAREVMELFSCGVYSQNNRGVIQLDSSGVPIENYDNEDITEMAKVFTGFTFGEEDGSPAKWQTTVSSSPGFYKYPMAINDNFHDTTAKTLPDGSIIPANGTGESDVAQALDWVSYHPSTAPYFSRLLIQRFTSSNPSEDYIERVVANWNGGGNYGTPGQIGDMKAVLKAILLDPEARDAVIYRQNRNRTDNTVRILADSSDPFVGKVQEPVLKMTHFLRFCGVTTNETDGYLRLPDSARSQGQEVLFSKSVFNFYSANYSPASGPIGEETVYELTAPECEIMGPNVIPELEKVYTLCVNKETEEFQGGKASLNNLQQIYNNSSDVTEFINYIDLMMCAGRIPRAVSEEIANQIENSPETNDETKLAQVMALVFSSADFSVVR